MLGLGLGLTNFGTRGGVSDVPDALSGASSLLDGEDGLAIDFSDQSIAIRDTTTPANNIASAGTVRNSALVGPGAKITYTSPSPKLCKRSDGTYGYRAQNLYLNSEAPANQSITVVSGLPYIIAVTGTVSITLSGAATGTVTAGNPITFTAATGTLTCGSTSGAGTVHLRSTIAAPDYIKTTTTPLYDLPYDWTDTYYYPLVEPAATNLFLNNRAAVTQNVSVTAQAYTLSFFGTGTITLSGASTAGPLVGTGANDRVSLTFTPSAGTLTLTVSGTMDLVQIETGTVATSPIITAGATVTRGADQPTIPTSAFPNVQAAITLYAEAIVRGDQSQGRFIQIDDGTSSEAHRISRQGADTAAFSTTDGGSGQSNIIPGTTGALAIGATIKAAYAVQANSAQAAVNGTLGTEDTSLTMPTTTTLRLGHANGGGSQLAQHIKRVMVLPRRMSNAALITLTGGTPTVLQKEDALSIQLNSGDEIAVSSDINRLSDADLDGTEWVVVVQDGVTKKASVETLKDYLS